MLPLTDRNPLLPALLAFLAGAMTAGIAWQPTTSALFWFSAAIISILAILILLKCPQKRSWLLIPLLSLYFLCGLLYTESFLTPQLPACHLTGLIPKNQDACLTGKLTKKPVFKNGRTQLTLETDSILLPGTDAPLVSKGRVMLTVNAPSVTGLIPGQNYLVRTRLSLPDKPTTPGTFDYAGYLAAEDILVKGWVASPVFIRSILPPAAGRFPLLDTYFLERYRQQFEAFLHANLAPKNAALYQALLIGDRSSLSPEILEKYQAAGIMHLLAISGTHLVVVAFLTTIFFRFVIGRFPIILLLRFPAAKIALALSFSLLLLYAGLAGFQPPVMRALIMTGVFMTAMILDRQWSSLNNLAIAAFCILLLNPLSIRTASFQLTFAATAAIILALPRLVDLLPQPGKRSPLENFRSFITTGLFLSSAAFLATAPLAMFHFNRISLLSPVTTLLATPFLCFWTMPMGLLAMILQPITPLLAVWLLKTGALGIGFSHALTAFLANLPFSSLWLPSPTIPQLLLCYGLLLLLFHVKRPLYILTALACLMLILSGYTPLPKWQGKSAEISFLAVGNGSATVVELPDNSVILIDGGGSPRELPTVGERVIAPFLWHRQIRKVDQIILTHVHADHFNGLPWIIKRFHPKILWLSETNTQEAGFAALLQEAKLTGCQIRIAEPMEVLARGDKGFVITCLANLALAKNNTSAVNEKYAPDNPNNRGLVLRLDYGDNSFFFPGDIEMDCEEHILQKGNRLKADVLLMPHHGLGSSGSARFMEAIAPRYCVVSTGRKDPFPPAQYRDTGGDIFSTARHGTVFFLSDGKRITARSYRSAEETPDIL